MLLVWVTCRFSARVKRVTFGPLQYDSFILNLWTGSFNELNRPTDLFRNLTSGGLKTYCTSKNVKVLNVSSSWDLNPDSEVCRLCRVHKSHLEKTRPLFSYSLSSFIPRVFSSSLNTSLHMIRLNLITVGLMRPLAWLSGPFLHNQFFWS